MPQVLVFGEIFGGAYPHEAVAAVDGVQAVQTGVYYCPGIEFSAFDLAIRGSDTDSHHYLDYEKALLIFQSASLFHAVPLHVGTWTNCLSYDAAFSSTVSARLGMPALKGNKAEGIVIKSLTEMHFATRGGGHTRAILKKKIAEFAEDKRFHQAQKWAPPAANGSNLPLLTVLLLEIDALMTTNRLAAAVSKVGPLVSRGEKGQVVPNKARMKEVLAMIVDDLREELGRRMSNMLRALTVAERQTMEDSVTEQGKLLILDFVRSQSPASP